MKAKKLLAASVLLCGIIVTPCIASICTNLQTTQKNQETMLSWSCKNALAQKKAERLYHSNLTWVPSCIQLRQELLEGAEITADVQCSCPAGFTDHNFAESAFQLGRGVVTPRQLRRMTCGAACPRPYESALSLADPEMCACHNSEGCLFSSRRFFAQESLSASQSLADKYVVLIPDDLRKPQETIPCFQLCAQVVDPVHVGQCALVGVQYQFCEEVTVAAACAPHFYQDQSSGACLPCPSCAPGEEPKTPCKHDAPPTCVPCDDGFFSAFGEQCQACAKNEHSSPLRDHCVKNSGQRPLDFAGASGDCPPGEVYVLAAGTCSPCPKNTAQDGSVCKACPAGHHALQEGSLTCTPCPHSHTRPLGEPACLPCKDGFFALPGAHECARCPVNSVRTAGMPSCVPCQASFYSTDGENCLPCPRARQVHSANSSGCDFCPRGMEFDNALQICTPCVSSPRVVCPFGFVQDDCMSGEKAPCVCNSCIRPPNCSPGFKRSAGHCVPSFEAESSFERYDPYNVTDSVLKPCYSFLHNTPEMTPSIMREKYHMQQSNSCPAESETRQLNETILLKHVAPIYKLTPTINECRFCCVSGHAFKNDLRLGLGLCMNSSEAIDFVIS